MRRWIALALRLALGAVFVYAAYTKLRQSWLLFALSIDSYRMLPVWAVFAVARTLPWLELVLGLLLLSGIWLRYSSIVVAAILSLFFTVMVVMYYRGGGIDCGCFGVGEALSARTLARDGALLAAAITLVAIQWSQGRLKPTPTSSLPGHADCSQLPREEDPCLKKKRCDARPETSARERPRALRPANSSAKKCTM